MNPAFEVYAKANGRSPESRLANDIGEFEQPMAGFHAWQNKKLDEFAALKGWQPGVDGVYAVSREAVEEFKTWLLATNKEEME